MAENEATLQFIEDYRSLPQLWDPNHTYYTNKIKRRGALRSLATKHGINIDEVKKKIKSLRSYFCKEYQKTKKKIGTGTDDGYKYKSSWFAYKHLLFIVDSMHPRTTVEPIATDIPADGDETKNCYTETLDTEASTDSQSTCVNSDNELKRVQTVQKVQLPIRKRILKSTNEDKKLESYSFKRNAAGQLVQRDEYTIFGQLVCHKIRNLNPRNRLIAQQRINNILFELEMEQMNVAEPDLSVYVKSKSD